MANTFSARQFLASDDAKQIREELERMMVNTGFNTKSTYTPTQETKQLFVDKHMRYLSLHTNIDPRQYVSNLRLRTQISK